VMLKPPLSPAQRASVHRSVDGLVDGADREAIEEWFALPQRCLGGCRPRDLILAGRGALVEHAARRVGQVLRRRRGGL
jgi:hypothetical protein